MNGAEALAYPPDEPVVLRAAAARAGRLAEVTARAVDDLTRDARSLAAAWSGPAARGCRSELAEVTALVRSLGEPLHGSGAALRAHAQVLEEARSRVDALRREYDELVAVDDGGLPAPVQRLQAEEVQAAHRAELAAVHRRHHGELDLVAEHARQTQRRLLAAAAAVVPRQRGHGSPVTDREGDLAGLLPLLAGARRAAGVGPAPPPAATPPQLVRQWWAALTSDEQVRAVASWPAALGALAGLPAAVRTAANERRLAQDVRMLRSRRTLADGDARWLANCLTVRRQLARVRAAVDPSSRAPMTAQLLVFDPTAYGDEGRAAIAVGDLDTADNVAFLVPGLGSEVRDTMAALTIKAVRVTAEARRVAPARTTATVAWMGYDAPGLAGVAFAGAAGRGADLLAADVLAVQAARDVAPHLTVVAHSYGSTTAGAALRDRETGTDDLVLVGSPGADVDRASDLHLPAGHVFVGASSRDPVSYLDRFGANPAHASFGATRFEAEDVTRDPWRLDGADHVKYFNAGTESLANIARVVTSDYPAVVRAPYRDDVFLLPDGINSDPEADRDPTTVP